MFGSLTIFGRTLPIPQCPQYGISAFGEHVLHLVLHVHCAHSDTYQACATGVYKRLEKRQERPC